MQTVLSSSSTADRYDDGIQIDYATMIRMWSAFDRSLSAFNRKCGVITFRDKTHRQERAKTENNNKS